MISQQQLKGQWQSIRGKVKEKWGQLTDNDLLQFEGGMEKLVGRIQTKTGETKKNIEEFLEKSLQAAGPTLEAVVDNVTAATQKVADAVQGGYQSTQKAVREGYDAAEAQLQNRPIESMLTVFGVGALVGAALMLMLCSGNDGA